jgi:hypothetical protein
VSAGRCRACGGDILWARTVHGRRQAIDLEPREDGDLAVHRDHTGRINARVLPPGEEPESYERRAMPHAATCPGAPPRPSRDCVASLGAARDRRRRGDFARRRELRQ